MNLPYQLVYLALSMTGLLTNFSTMIYLFKTFDISTHVFALIFLDALICIFSSGISIGLNIFLLTGNTDTNYLNCSIFFLTSYLPSNCGALLTLLIVSVRYLLAKKAAQNIQMSKKKILFCSLLIFALLSISTISYFVVAIVEGKPVSLFVEACTTYKEENQIVYSFLHIVILQLPTFYNFLSLIIDILLLRFLKRTIVSVHLHQGKNL